MNKVQTHATLVKEMIWDSTKFSLIKKMFAFLFLLLVTKLSLNKTKLNKWLHLHVRYMHVGSGSIEVARTFGQKQ